MSENKDLGAGHTAGPWIVGSKGGRAQPSVFGADGSPVASCGGNAPGYGHYSVETHQRRLANARLIAAAPALFEAIETWLADYDDDRRDLQLEHDHAARFRVLVAKVRGDIRGVQP